MTSFIKICHVCGQLVEAPREIERCPRCQKCFLPLNYFSKVHEQGASKFHELFSSSDELLEEDMIKGLSVLWEA